MDVEFEITQTAVDKIKTICEKEKKIGYGLRVRAANGGCSGLQYELGLDEKAQDSDQVIEAHGLKIFIDPQSADMIHQAKLDYVEGPMGCGFKVTNPNTPKTGGGGGCGSGGGGCGSGSGHGGHGEQKGGCGSGCGCGA